MPVDGSFVAYKYRPLPKDLESDNGEIERVREIVQDNKLFYAPPTTLNDPFDCDVTGDKERFLRGLLDPRVIEMCNISESKQDYIRFEIAVAAHLRKNYSESVEFEKLREGFRNSLDELIGVLSLSRSPDIPLMWAHYGGDHRGVAIGVRVYPEILRKEVNDDIDKPSRIYVRDVNYCTTPNDFTAAWKQREDEDGADTMFDVLCQKTLPWQYEQEVRSLFEIDESICFRERQKRKFLREDLVELVFGARVNQEVKKQVLGRILEDDPNSRLLVKGVFISGWGKLEVPKPDGDN